MKNLTLEVSLKPFFGLNNEETLQICQRALDQWKLLIEQSEQVSVLFWAADGSEILEYNGKLDDEMEWARFIGNANAHSIIADPSGESITPVYTENCSATGPKRLWTTSAEVSARVWRYQRASISPPSAKPNTFAR